ncbi:DUF1302 domain-containing protein [Massilia niastensis]|uniref:DUF1302 domain-containing protein n=1 Tax=Massilia niastensis TaxID=544911 RepID=UPI0003AA32D3|nr:DUF1302 family protein [Massilia niastensis]
MRIKTQPTLIASAMLALWGGGPAFAGEPIEFGNGFKLDWRANASYTVATRLESQDPVLKGAAGSNDGDNNFDRHALTANRAAVLIDATLSRGESGLVLSGSTFYDDAYHRTNDNRGPVNKPGPVNVFTDEARRYHGGYSRLLDAYGYTSFSLGGTSRATVRVGRHAVSWGEALFFPGISLAQGPADGTKTNIPGTETKDQLLPEDQVSAIIEVSPSWSLLAHAQFNFHETLAPAPGSYLSTSDGVGEGGTCLNPYINDRCSFGLRGPDILPGKTGQWGVGSRYRVTDETEVGLYYLNYHDRSPIPEINAFNSSYRIRYFDDIKLAGATLSTTFGKTTLAGELSYKRGAPVLVDTVVNPATRASIPTPTRADVAQLNINAFANLGRNPLADSTILLGEISAVRVSRVEARKAPGVEALGASAAFFPASDTLSFTRSGVAATVQMVLGYPGVFEGWDLSVPISYSHQLRGRTLVGGVGGQGDRRTSIGMTWTYRSNLQIGLTYLGFFGEPNLTLPHNRLLTDRDQLSMVVKYAF